MAVLTTLVLLAVLYHASNADTTTENPNFNNSGDNPMVTLAQGQLQGITLQSTNDTEFYAFLGIPYGTAERFQAPQASQPWEGVLDATEDAAVCLQYDSLVMFDIVGVENCLTLNLYTPKIPGPNDKSKLLPVMVFVNGELYQEENPSRSIYGPERLLNYPIILVLMNYRVGPLGFLSTGDSVAPGNYGHLDQVLALKWVQTNIIKFGGDPESVTLAGQGAGAASVIYHMLSPLSTGLFSGAIAQSGNALSPWSLQPNPLKVAINLAQKLNCPTQSSKMLISCLQDADPSAIISASNQSSYFFSIANAPLPAVEKPVTPSSFLIDQPFSLLYNGKLNKVPLITGVTRDEGASLVNDNRIFDFLSGPKDDFVNSFPNLIEFLTGFDVSNSNISAVIYNEYFQDVDMDNFTDVLRTGIELASDAIFNGCNDATIRLMSAAGVPVFSYVFDYIGEDNVQSNYTGSPDIDHGTDLLYLFENDMLGNSNFTSEEESFSDQYINLWVNFMENGNPTPSGNFKWLPAQAGDFQYLLLGLNMTMQANYRQEKMNFWRNILLQHFQNNEF